MMDIVVKIIIGAILGIPALIAWFYGLFLLFAGEWGSEDADKGFVLIGFGFVTGLIAAIVTFSEY